MDTGNQAISPPERPMNPKWNKFVSAFDSSCSYLSLPEGDFMRVIELLPDPIITAPIICTTRVQEIRPNPPEQYEAVSYAWGDTRNCLKIILNGAEAYITKNLHDALQHIRSKTCSRFLWIDQICIDQSNGKEKNHQVSLMREIFSNASSVIAWWGLEEPSTQSIVPCINNEDREATQTEMASIIGLPYWTRVWIVQEIVVAQEITIHWGTYIIQWTAFVRFIRHAYSPRLLPDNREYIAFKCLAPILELIDLKRQDMPERTLLKLLRATEHMESTDPRDQVHALLGLVGNDPVKEVEVNYTISTCAVYCNAIRSINMDCQEHKRTDPIFHYSREHEPLAESHPGRQDCDGSCGSETLCIKLLPWILTKCCKGTGVSGDYRGLYHSDGTKQNYIVITH